MAKETDGPVRNEPPLRQHYRRPLQSRRPQDRSAYRDGYARRGTTNPQQPQALSDLFGCLRWSIDDSKTPMI